MAQNVKSGSLLNNQTGQFATMKMKERKALRESQQSSNQSEKSQNHNESNYNAQSKQKNVDNLVTAS